MSVIGYIKSNKRKWKENPGCERFLLFPKFFQKASLLGVVNTVDCAAKCLTLYQVTLFLDWSKLQSFADNKVNVTEKLRFVFGQVEKKTLWEKEKMLVFKSLLFQGC